MNNSTLEVRVDVANVIQRIPDRTKVKNVLMMIGIPEEDTAIADTADISSALGSLDQADYDAMVKVIWSLR